MGAFFSLAGGLLQGGTNRLIAAQNNATAVGIANQQAQLSANVQTQDSANRAGENQAVITGVGILAVGGIIAILAWRL
jgi:hypothetical protein